MPINLDKPHLWKQDIARSVDMYNSWFMQFAPKAFRDKRVTTTKQVEFALRSTENLTNVTPDLLRQHPTVLPMLRMSTCPPIARDRLIGLAGISKNLVESMENAENPRIPPRMPADMAMQSVLVYFFADILTVVILGTKLPRGLIGCGNTELTTWPSMGFDHGTAYTS